MIIAGLQKTTLLDFPGHLAATIFLGGCNFRCPYCHNSELISPDCTAAYSSDQILAFLKKRTGILEGVCLTGGEPSLQSDLESLIRSIRDLGFLIKLDTNGYRPDVLTHLCEAHLVDYVAMDIKAGRTHYPAASGLARPNLSLIDESIHFLLDSGIRYEFRTTVVKGIHTRQDFEEIGPWIAGAKAYFLQNYKAPESVSLPGMQSFSKEDLLRFAAVIAPYVPDVKLRGID